MRNHSPKRALKAAGRIGPTSRDLCSTALHCIAWRSRLGGAICLFLTALSIGFSRAAESGNVLDPVNLESFDSTTPAAPLAPQPSAQITPPGAESSFPTSSPQPTVQVNGARQVASHLQVTPIVQLRTVYDDNLYQRREKTADVYFRTSVGLAVGSGDFRDQVSPLGGYQQAYENLQIANFDDRNYFYLAYEPSFTSFVQHGELDTLDHDGSLGVQWRLGNLIVGLRTGVRTFSEGDPEIGDRVRQTLFSSDLTTRYELSDKTNLESNFYYINHDYNSGERVNSAEWVNQDFLNYQILPKTNLGAGITLGYDDVSAGADQTYEQALGRIIYDTTHKFTFTVQGGVEFRQVASTEKSGGRDSINPVFTVAANYTPFDGTNINLTGQRSVRNSINYIGENVTSTTVGATLTQRLFQKVTLTLGANYEHDDFDRSSAVVGISRTDDLINLQFGLGFHLTRWVGITTTYTYRHDSSTIYIYNFANNRASMQIDVLF